MQLWRVLREQGIMVRTSFGEFWIIVIVNLKERTQPPPPKKKTVFAVVLRHTSNRPFFGIQSVRSVIMIGVSFIISADELPWKLHVSQLRWSLGWDDVLAPGTGKKGPKVDPNKTERCWCWSWGMSYVICCQLCCSDYRCGDCRGFGWNDVYLMSCENE